LKHKFCAAACADEGCALSICVQESEQAVIINNLDCGDCVWADQWSDRDGAPNDLHGRKKVMGDELVRCGGRGADGWGWDWDWG